MEIRLAQLSDSKFLSDIYKQYINTETTFEYIAPTPEEFQNRIKEIYQTYPYIVCTENEKPIGYAYAHRYKARAAYEWDVEISVYIDKNCTSKGLGTRLCSVLIEILKLQGIKNVYSYITEPNIQSKKLHLKLGFKSVGTYHNTGFKNGKWLDIETFEKQIGSYNVQPSNIIPITQLPMKQLEKIFNSYCS